MMGQSNIGETDKLFHVRRCSFAELEDVLNDVNANPSTSVIDVVCCEGQFGIIYIDAGSLPSAFPGFGDKDPSDDLPN